MRKSAIAFFQPADWQHVAKGGGGIFLYVDHTLGTSVILEFERNPNHRTNVWKFWGVLKTTAPFNTSNPAHAFRLLHHSKKNWLHLFCPTWLRLKSGHDLHVVTLQSQENVHHSTFSYTVETGFFFFVFLSCLNQADTFPTGYWAVN